MIEIVALVLGAVALGLAAGAILLAWTTRGSVQGVVAVAHSHPRSTVSRRREPAEEREVNLGPPPEVPERREHDLGPTARHRAPEVERYGRLRASAAARDPEPPTEAIPRVEPGQPATAEHPAPTSTFRRPPPPLPRPGQIDR